MHLHADVIEDGPVADGLAQVFRTCCYSAHRFAPSFFFN